MGWLALWLAGRLAVWLSGCLAVWLSGLLAGWLAAWTANWLAALSCGLSASVQARRDAGSIRILLIDTGKTSERKRNRMAPGGSLG